MLIPRELLIEAKLKLGEQAAKMIADDLKLEQYDEKNLKSVCPFHDEDTPSFVWNPKDACFKCFGCGTNYGIIDHYMSFRKMTFLNAVEELFSLTGTSFRFGERGVKTNSDYKYPAHVDSSTREKVERYLANRNLGIETLDFADVQQDPDGNCVFHFYDANDVLVAVKYRPARKTVKPERKYWAQENCDNDAGALYMMNKADPTQPLIITEGEIDALSILESGVSNVVSVPNGASLGKSDNSWIQKNFEWLGQFKSIILWFDNDKPGEEGRKIACSRLGTWRVRNVTLPPVMEKGKEKIPVKDANDVLCAFGAEAVRRLIVDAKDVPVENIIDLNEVQDFNIETAPGLFSSIRSIDKIIYKFLYGSVVILTGRKGHGKSTFLNQVFLCEALNQGEQVFVFSGELGTSVLKYWIETTMIGREYIEMKNSFVRRFQPDALRIMREWYNGKVKVYDGISNRADEVLDRAVDVTRKYGIKIWILDNLLTLDIGATSDNEYLAQKDFVVKLVSLAKTYGVLIVLVSHPRKMGGIEIDRKLGSDDIAGSGHIGNLAQYIVSIHRYSEQERAGEIDSRGGFKKGHEPVLHDVACEILKNRYTGKMGKVNLFFDYDSYRFYQTTVELFKRFAWNKTTAALPTVDPNDHEGHAPEAFGGED